MVVQHGGSVGLRRESIEFIKLFRVESKAFIAQRCSNRSGQYLAMAKFGGGG
jgi:hypothetical protein